MIEADPASDIPGADAIRRDTWTIDSSGMLMGATGEPVTAVGDTFVVHMDREALNDYPLGRYDVTVTITALVPDREIAWKVTGRIRPRSVTSTGTGSSPPGTRARWSPRTTTGHRSTALAERNLPSSGGARATGVLARTVARGYVGGGPPGEAYNASKARD